MNVKPQVIPTDGFALAVAEHALVPVLNELKSQFACSFSIHLALWKHRYFVAEIGDYSVLMTDAANVHQGEARVRFRDTAVPGRYLFCLDAVLSRDSCDSPFSGFRIKGDVVLRGQDYVTKSTALIVKHGDYSWHPWL